MTYTEALKRAQKKYRSKKKEVAFRLDREKDLDIIEWMKTCENVTGRIKDLIRSDIQKKDA